MIVSDDSPGTAWDEAQRLLDERGPWTTAGGAYLEGEQVTVLIHPVGDPNPAANLVDLVVTVRFRRPPGFPQGAGVSLLGTAGGSVFRPLSRRGQAVFRRLPAGEWTARLRSGSTASGSSHAVDADVIPLRSIPRLLAAAAGDRQHVLHETYTSLDGRVTTEVAETPEGRLVVEISAVGPSSGVSMARMRWAVLAPGVTETVKTLVVPLAENEDGTVLVTKYDLGSLEHVHAVKIGPAETADPSELTGDLVRQAFGLALYGTARRAWENLAASDLCLPATRAVLLEMLER